VAEGYREAQKAVENGSSILHLAFSMKPPLQVAQNSWMKTICLLLELSAFISE
jgi:hypothetical protein